MALIRRNTYYVAFFLYALGAALCWAQDSTEYGPGDFDAESLRARAERIGQAGNNVDDATLRTALERAHEHARRAFDQGDYERAGRALTFMETRLRDAGILTTDPASNQPNLTAGWIPIDENSFPANSNLSAGVAKVDITPPVGTVTVGHERTTTSVRDSLEAGVIVFDNGTTRAAIVTFDLCGMMYREVEALRAAVGEAADVPPASILIAASHNHSGPRPELGVPHTDRALAAMTEAATTAANAMRPVTLAYGEDRIGFAVNRRLRQPGGKIGGPDFDGASDARARAIVLDDGSPFAPMAVLMHAVCHPACFIKDAPYLSADFSGEAQQFVERAFEGETKALFLQGFCGNTRPAVLTNDGVFTGGSDLENRWAGFDLGSAITRSVARTLIRTERANRPESYAIASAFETIYLPARGDLGDQRPFQDTNFVERDGRIHIRLDLQALRIGEFLFVTLPGEPFVQHGWYLEEPIDFDGTIIPVGYANGYVGYLCTEDAYAAGGYEPSVSLITAESIQPMLTELIGVAEAALEQE